MARWSLAATLVGFSTAHFLLGCQYLYIGPPRLISPKEFAQVQGMKATSKGFSVNKEVLFGPFGVYPRASSSGETREMEGEGKGDSATVQESYAFKLVAPGDQEWFGDCNSRLAVSKYQRGFLALFTEKHDFSTYCQFHDASSGRVAELELNGNPDQFYTLSGELSGLGVKYQVQSVVEKLRYKKIPVSFSGYRLQRDNRTIGMVGLTEAQGVWIQPEATREDTVAVALASSAMLLHRELGSMVDRATEILESNQGF